MVLTLALAAVLAPPHVQATLKVPTGPAVAGRAVAATLVLRPAPRARPVVVARRAGTKARRFSARAIGPGRYRVRLTFPSSGRWRLSARIGARELKLRSLVVRPMPPPRSPLPGATAYRVCGGASTPPYQQYGLAIGFGSAWVGCGPQQEIQRYDLGTGRLVAHVRLPGVQVWSVTAGEGAVWAIELGGNTAYRINPASNRVAARIALGASVPYIWAGAGAFWAADDPGRELVRVDPKTNTVVARIPSGNGTSAFTTDGTFVWVLNHRENTLDRIDTRTNSITRLSGGLGPADTSAVERIALFGGILWATGRGSDLLRVSPTSGAVLGSTEIGPAGIDVVTDGSNLWAAAYDAAAEPRGDPIAGAVHRLAADGSLLQTVTPTKRLFVNGLAAVNGQLWVFDSVAGLLLRLPA